MAEDRCSLATGTVYAARYQSAGRGQRGNSWQSRAGENLTFSLLLRPESLPAAHQAVISQIVTLGITDFLLQAGLEARIKWPNDIYVEDRKICGILIENTLATDRLSDSIVGIGLNLNQREFDPALPNPTSLLLETGRTVTPEDALPGLLECIGGRYLRHIAESPGWDALQKDYLERLYRFGQWHRYRDCRECSDRLTPTTEDIGGEIFEGCIRGIDENAGLIIEDRAGHLRHFAFKELRYII
ncbi:MAG: biotin--[Bacteroidales bacterium]|nr:biotin--[acetyl-CoA-carboxylase] ligase [Bacteroidales bacterium]